MGFKIQHDYPDTHLHVPKVCFVQVIHEGGHGLLDAVLCLVHHGAVPAARAWRVAGGDQLGRGASACPAPGGGGGMNIVVLINLQFFAITPPPSYKL